jgi:serine protease Do
VGRSDEGVRYVQTSAPISPGSSGGGSFDSQGNLVRITTLALAGEQRLNQSLNFAIAADLFWQP